MTLNDQTYRNIKNGFDHEEPLSTSTSPQDIAERRGVLTLLKMRLQRNRLGEVLVQSGRLTPEQLKNALETQRNENLPLGVVLVKHGLVNARALRSALYQQIAFRTMAAGVTLFLSLASFGGVKSARAGTMKDIPSSITLAAYGGQGAHTQPIYYYPALFGTAEKKSTNLRPFTKWSGMFDRFEKSVNAPENQRQLANWKADLQQVPTGSLRVMATKVNDIINKQKYIVDSKNYGQNDYWSTPMEFFARGGDCEDYAIAKYASLRMLGVPDDRMRIAIVQDTVQNIPHALLIVYTDQGPLILDNQVNSVKSGAAPGRYKPIFSINRAGWWLHTAPTNGDPTLIASAAR